MKKIKKKLIGDWLFYGGKIYNPYKHEYIEGDLLLQNGKILQIPVRHYPRIAGKAKFHLTNRLIGPLLDCFAYLWMKKKYINYKVIDKA